MSKTATKPTGRRRTETKEKRREQLIRATIRSIAQHGLSWTTMATVSSEAGLSQGIINLHFQSKERLLVETLSFVVGEYRSAWEQALEKTPGDSADKVRALVDVDFSAAVCDRNKLAVWFAFWGESRSRPTYRKLCAQQDRVYRDVLAGLCADIIRDGGYRRLDPVIVAAGLISLSQGLWLDLLLIPRVRSRTMARNICLAHLARVFPRHFRDPMLLAN
ncbi:MAG: TetR family transcriptional regulator [Xanthomonadales bacterium]|nr:TetR family transcriptional regulator [Xanthomonadales bacterium]NIX14244.1 TetR family transcriptional regulator [Xanthomonadales bacterium]